MRYALVATVKVRLEVVSHYFMYSHRELLARLHHTIASRA